VDAASDFAGKHSIPRFYGSYAQLLADANVDAIYVSLPNSLHHEWTVLALQAGKHVLCEKPMAANAAESEQMFDEAERAGRLVMEAFMYRCHPQTLGVVEAVRNGAIGQLKLIRTSFCYRTTRVAENIRFRSDLAGGALMDVGCYCLSFSRLIAGAEPIDAAVTGHVHASGVDDLAAGLLRFPGANGNRAEPVVATFACGMGAQADNTAMVCGSEGYIEIPVPWKPPGSGATWVIARSTPPKMDLATMRQSAGPVVPPGQTFTADAGMDVFGVEADDFAASVLDGRPPRVTRQDTMGNMLLLDSLRKKIMNA
jgi:predicted dehydrogenase